MKQYRQEDLFAIKERIKQVRDRSLDLRMDTIEFVTVVKPFDAELVRHIRDAYWPMVYSYNSLNAAIDVLEKLYEDLLNENSATTITC